LHKSVRDNKYRVIFRKVYKTLSDRYTYINQSVSQSVNQVINRNKQVDKLQPITVMQQCHSSVSNNNNNSYHNNN